LNIPEYSKEYSTFSKSRNPVGFLYMLGGVVFFFMNDLGVILDIKMSFFDDLDSMVGKALTILGFIKRISRENTDCSTIFQTYK
jgi:hypothetical protein